MVGEVLGMVGSVLGGGVVGVLADRGVRAYRASLDARAQREVREAEAAKAAGHEETARHRTGTAAVERALDTEKREHGECQEALTEARQLASDVRVELAECRRDRTYQQRINEWMRERMDRIDGGSTPPPPIDLEPESAE